MKKENDNISKKFIILGLRPYLGRFHRSDPELDDQETQGIHQNMISISDVTTFKIIF